LLNVVSWVVGIVLVDVVPVVPVVDVTEVEVPPVEVVIVVLTVAVPPSLESVPGFPVKGLTLPSVDQLSLVVLFGFVW
jgi:hypothetical protein